MKHNIFATVAWMVTAALLPSWTAAQDNPGPLAPDALFARASLSVWVMQTRDVGGGILSTGTAVAIAPDRVVTNCGLLAKAGSVVLKRDNVSYGATLEFPDVQRDMCQLRVPNLASPGAGVAPVAALKIGMPVYVIGSPRGQEMSMGVNMLSSVRRDAANDLEALQLAMPIEAGLSGAGVFDPQGRLIGLTSATSPGSTPPYLVMPAAWVSELQARGLHAIERLATDPAPNTATGSAPAGPHRPSIVEYEMLDRLTNIRRKVVYRADPGAADGRISFNNGGWVEKPGGEVISITSAAAGEFDTAMPPGGWSRENLANAISWTTRYSSKLGGNNINMDLRATVMGDSVFTVAGQEIKVVQIEYRGFTERFAGASTVSNGNQFGPYRANVWFSRELGRVVRFEVQTRGGWGSSAYQVDEVLALQSVR